MNAKGLLSLFAIVPMLLCGAELWSGKAWKNALPVTWDFDSGDGSDRFVAAAEKVPASAVLTLGGKKKTACLTCREKVCFPRGSEVTVSGEYRTVDYTPGADGTIIANIAYNYGQKDQSWQCVFLKPTNGEWKSFTNSKRIPVEATGSFRAYFYAKGSAGRVEWRNLSMSVREDSCEMRPEHIYVWREAENVHRLSPPIPDPDTSGKGAAYVEKGKAITWKFRITPETDPHTLFDRHYRYSLWGRVYGYLGNPEITVSLNNRIINSVRTVANEKADAKGDYAGPGSYYWQYLGTFESKGGSYTLKLTAPRICLDALLVTDDPNFQPKAFEAAKATQKRFTDVSCANEVYPDFVHVGVAPEVAGPVTFRMTKPERIIPDGGKPAKFHFSVPQSVRVVEASTMRSTVEWGQKETWHGRKLAWRRTGSSKFNGIAMDDYEMDVYYICGNQYWWYLQVKPGEFVENKRVPARYWLENGNDKQTPETLWLTMVSVPQTRAFKKIYVFGSGVSVNGFWSGWKGIFDTSKKTGLNAFGCWNFEETDPATINAFLKKSKEERIRVFGAMSPFCPPFFEPAGKERAVGQNGQPRRSRDRNWAPSLAIDENSPSMRKMCEHLRKSAKSGSMGMMLDDEWSNQIGDEIDYGPETKELFRKYLKDHGKEYVDPLEIVKNQKSMPELYELWVSFRCERVAEFYRLWKAAYLSGLADKSDPLFITGIQGKGPNPDLIRRTNFFDYRLLAKHCDLISIMCYMYRYTVDSAVIGDTLAMYTRYIGRPATTPSLLSDYEGHEVPLEHKASLKYQLWEALMQQARAIDYWMSYGVYNPINLRHVSEGIRQLVDHEDILLQGTPCCDFKTDQQWLRLVGLKLGKKMLVYGANYQYPADSKAIITISLPVKRITALADGKTVKCEKNQFAFDSAKERGQLFLVELE